LEFMKADIRFQNALFFSGRGCDSRSKLVRTPFRGPGLQTEIPSHFCRCAQAG
jgi:hypothetical protein